MRLIQTRRVLSSGFFLIIFGGLAFTGCASLEMSNLDQVVPVTSEPEGATVYYREERIGQTPLFLKIERAYQDEIRLEKPGFLSKKVPLETSYRWKDSFFSDFIFLSYAPVAWTVDILSGAAWTFEPSPSARLKPESDSSARPPSKQPPQRRVIAISPPVGRSQKTSDQLGEIILSRWKEAHPKDQVLSFSQTQLAFFAHHFDFYRMPSQDHQNALARELKITDGVTHVITSDFQVDQDVVHVKLTLRDIFGQQPEEKLSYEIPVTQISQSPESLWQHRMGSFFHFVPNNVSLASANSSYSLEVNNETYEAVNESSSDFWGQSLRYLGAIGLSHIEGPGYNGRERFVLRFVPSGSISYGEVRFPELQLVADERFKRLAITTGYGGQIGWRFKSGFLNYDFVPALGWSRLSWRGGSHSRFHLSAIMELGYTQFLTDHWNLRIFAQGVLENQKIWERALERTSGQQIQLESVGYGYGGIAIGYYFPADFHPLRFLFRKTKR